MARGLTGCGYTYSTLCSAPGMSDFFLISGEDFFREGRRMECRGQVATHTSERVIISLSFCSLQVRDGPETVNTKFLLCKGGSLFHQNGLTKGAATSSEIRSTFPERSDPQGGRACHQATWAPGPSHWTLLRAVESLVSFSNGHSAPLFTAEGPTTESL